MLQLKAVQSQNQVVPWPGFDRAQTLPSCACTIWYTIASPSPVPPSKFDWNGSKIFSICCGVIPVPVSTKADLPIVFHDSTAAVSVPPFFHGTHRVLAEVPENLLELVAVGDRPAPRGRQTGARS